MLTRINRPRQGSRNTISPSRPRAGARWGFPLLMVRTLCKIKNLGCAAGGSVEVRGETARHVKSNDGGETVGGDHSGQHVLGRSSRVVVLTSPVGQSGPRVWWGTPPHPTGSSPARAAPRLKCCCDSNLSVLASRNAEIRLSGGKGKSSKSDRPQPYFFHERHGLTRKLGVT